MEMKHTNAVILAAGAGKRMRSRCSKVLCEVGGKPMLNWVIDAAKKAGAERICVVVSTDDVKAAAEAAGCETRIQSERLGTGHAVRMAEDFLAACPDGDTLILNGDAPFMDADTVRAAYRQHKAENNAVTVVTAVLDDAANYGRIVRKDGRLAAIVEKADCNEEQAAIREINSGAFWFGTEKLIDALSRITNSNAQGEYYLTDAVALLIASGENAGAAVSENTDVVRGANSPAELLMLSEAAAAAAINKHLEAGVQFRLRDGILIGPDVEIGEGTVILPGCIITGNTRIGGGCVIGPNSTVHNTVIGEDVVFESSKATDSTVGDGSNIGPFVQLRPGSNIGKKVKIGDFVEVKNSNIGDGTSVSHLTYIGDADVGRFCNFGCGTVFVNYDGEKKNRITVGDYCFIGCNTNLVAPVTLGEGAYTAAGATVTKDVPAGALAISREQLTIKDGWAARKLKKYIEKKQPK